MTTSQFAVGGGLACVSVMGGLILYILVGLRDDVKNLAACVVTDDRCAERRMNCSPARSVEAVSYSIKHHSHDGLPDDAQVIFKGGNA